MRKNLIIGGQEIITNFRERTWMNFKEDIQVWKIYLRQYFWSGSKNILKDKNHNTNFFTYVPEKSEDRSIVFSFFSLKKTEDRSIVFFSFFFFPLKNRGLVYWFLDSYLLTPPIRSIKVISQILVFVQLRDRTILKHIFWDRQFICKIGDLSKHFDISSYLKIVKTFLQQIKIVKTFLQKNKIVKSSLQNIEIVKTSLRKNKKCKKVFT